MATGESFKMPEIPNVEEVVKMLTEVERVEKLKLDLIAKMKRLARLDEEIVRVSFNFRRQESPSQLTYTCKGMEEQVKMKKMRLELRVSHNSGAYTVSSQLRGGAAIILLTECLRRAKWRGRSSTGGRRGTTERDGGEWDGGEREGGEREEVRVDGARGGRVEELDVVEEVDMDVVKVEVDEEEVEEDKVEEEKMDEEEVDVKGKKATYNAGGGNRWQGGKVFFFYF